MIIKLGFSKLELLTFEKYNSKKSPDEFGWLSKMPTQFCAIFTVPFEFYCVCHNSFIGSILKYSMSYD